MLEFVDDDRNAGVPRRELDTALRDGRAEDARWHARKDGSQFWASGLLTAARGDDGRSLGFLKVLRDDTVRKLADDAILASKNAAEAANRVEDEFLATLGHELRTPLSAILVWAKMLRSSGRDLPREQLDEGLDAITRGAAAQRQLLDDLLDSSRISAGTLRLDLRRIEIADVVKASVASVLPSAQARGVLLDMEIGADVGVVWADPHRIQQVVGNLLSNAIKFTSSGGRVSVTLTRLGQTIELRVTDTGKGIDPEFLPFVFEPFRQADGAKTTRAHGGLGLGLAICRQLVAQHGGTISARSGGLGFGTTVTVRLPLIALRPDAVDGSSPIGALTAILTGAGAAVTPVDSARAAYETFQRSVPDLLISDIGMSDEDGFGLIRRIRVLEAIRSMPPVPAVALTASWGNDIGGRQTNTSANRSIRTTSWWISRSCSDAHGRTRRPPGIDPVQTVTHTTPIAHPSAAPAATSDG